MSSSVARSLQTQNRITYLSFKEAGTMWIFPEALIVDSNFWLMPFDPLSRKQTNPIWNYECEKKYSKQSIYLNKNITIDLHPLCSWFQIADLLWRILQKLWPISHDSEYNSEDLPLHRFEWRTRVLGSESDDSMEFPNATNKHFNDATHL